MPTGRGALAKIKISSHKLPIESDHTLEEMETRESTLFDLMPNGMHYILFSNQHYGFALDVILSEGYL